MEKIIRTVDINKFEDIVNRFNQSDDIDQKDLIIAELLQEQARTIFSFHDQEISNDLLKDLKQIYSPRELERIYEEGKEKLNNIERRADTDYYMTIKFWLDEEGQRHYDFNIDEVDFDSDEFKNKFIDDITNNIKEAAKDIDLNELMEKLKDLNIDYDSFEDDENSLNP